MPEKIIAYGHPFLRQMCSDLENVGQVRQIQNLLMETTSISRTMVGLAAPQIGILHRVFIMRLGTEFKTVVNPLILKKRHTQRHEEGCMSIPGVLQLTETRADIIDVEFFDQDLNRKKMRLNGTESVIFQHELDHLNGILFVDHLTKEGRESIADKLSDIERGIAPDCSYELTFKPDVK